MTDCPETLEIQGHTYVRQDVLPETDANYVIVRGDRSATFAGELQSHAGQIVTLSNARRLWYWSGAASLSELAIRGPSNPAKCKFPAAVPEVTILDAIEIIPCTVAAVKAIAGVPEWTAQ